MEDWKDNSYHKKAKKTQKQNKHTQYKDTLATGERAVCSVPFCLSHSCYD